MIEAASKSSSLRARRQTMRILRNRCATLLAIVVDTVRMTHSLAKS